LKLNEEIFYILIFVNFFLNNACKENNKQIIIISDHKYVMIVIAKSFN